MAFPESPLIDAVWDNLPQYVRDADDGTLRQFLTAITSPVDTITDLLALGGGMASWRCPPDRLHWLAAITGIDVAGVPDDKLRDTIFNPVLYRYRGTPDTVAARVRMTLTGAQTVEVVYPYSGSVWRILVRTFTSETPDAAVTLAAIRREVPAWLRLTAETVAGQSYTNLAADYATYGTMTATGKTYGTLSQEI